MIPVIVNFSIHFSIKYIKFHQNVYFFELIFLINEDLFNVTKYFFCEFSILISNLNHNLLIQTRFCEIVEEDFPTFNNNLIKFHTIIN